MQTSYYRARHPPPLAIPLRLLIGATALSERVEEEEEEEEALPRNTLFARDLRLGGRRSVGRRYPHREREPGNGGGM